MKEFNRSLLGCARIPAASPAPLRWSMRCGHAVDGGGAPGGSEPVLLHNWDVPYDAASTMKVAVPVAVHRSGLDLDVQIPVVNEFRSVRAAATPGQ
ncbi:hypothetical protein [Streptomyces sp. RPT161]|uniref:hypothetical protein n=1 Tax=Streptomyces sp. RPT161 TaxID=3015993 RepID=UPI0022B8D8F4|nr:hypothetical protein [Streptomyces sp. RPT161]